ncbi:MAG TPA: hypothetical protein EYQ00_10490 [Dehalococcoidia bacterium]|jgi:YbbR domain-containing protein|nr:hypothetical protein [Dehalococcoidia bacterium]
MRDRFDLDEEISREEALELVKGLWNRIFSAAKSSPSLLIISFLLSLSLWIFVTDSENSRRVDGVPGLVSVSPVNVASDLAVVNVPSGVKIYAAATSDRWESLTAADFQASLDLSNYGEGEHLIDITPHINFGNKTSVRLVEVDPPQIVIILEPRITKTVVPGSRLTGSLASGFELGAIEFSSSQVSVSGPKSRIDLIDSVAVRLDVSDMQATSSRFLSFHAFDMNGSEIGGISISPPSTEVNVEITRNLSIRQVPVSISVSGIPKSGYRVTDVRTYPTVVEISGPQRFINEVNKLYTEDIDLEGEFENWSKRVALILPSGVTILGGDPNVKSFVTVAIDITPIIVTATLDLEVTLENLGEKLNVSEPPRVLVDVIGPIELVSDLSLQAVTATVDLFELTAGSHTVSVVVTLPDGLTAEKNSTVVIELVVAE